MFNFFGKLLTMFLLALSVLSCSNTSTVQTENNSLDAQIVGADRDQHQCIASAGYLWCAKTKVCERPWMLAKTAGFDNSEQGFSAYCGNP